MQKKLNTTESSTETSTTSKHFLAALKQTPGTADNGSLVDAIHKIRKIEFNAFAKRSSKTPVQILKHQFYVTYEKNCEEDIDLLLSQSKARVFKTNGGGQLQSVMTQSLPKAFLISKSFSELMESLFEWSLAAEKMSNTIIKCNYYVLDFSDDLLIKPNSNSQYSKIHFKLGKKKLVFLFLLRSIRFLMHRSSMLLPLKGRAKSAIKSTMFLMLTSSFSASRVFGKATYQALGSQMLVPSLLLLLKFFEKYIADKLIEVINEKEAEICAQAITKELKASFKFLTFMKAKIDNLFNEYMAYAPDKHKEYLASDRKVRIVRIIEAFLLNQDTDFDSFDIFLEKERLEIVEHKDGWIEAVELDEK